MSKASFIPANADEAETLAEISNLPLRQRIHQILRDAIISGELKPGQPLVETNLASQLGVSRAPIREALQSLSKDGLTETVAYRGTTVHRLTRKDIEEIYSLRGLHEGFAIERIVARARPSDIELLEGICLQMQEAAEAKDSKLLDQQDDHFHRTLIRLAEHDMLLTIWDQLSLRVRQLMSLRNQRNHDPMAVALNHPPIVAAIAEAKADLARSLISSHIGTASDSILDEFADDLP